MASLGVCGRPDTAVTHTVDAGARAMRAGIVEIRRGEGFWRFAAVHAGEEEGGGTFQHGERGAMEEIGEADVNGFFAAADGEREAAVRIELDAEAGWAAVAIEAGVHALEKRLAAGDDGRESWHSFLLG